MFACPPSERANQAKELRGDIGSLVGSSPSPSSPPPQANERTVRSIGRSLACLPPPSSHPSFPFPLHHPANGRTVRSLGRSVGRSLSLLPKQKKENQDKRKKQKKKQRSGWRAIRVGVVLVGAKISSFFSLPTFSRSFVELRLSLRDVIIENVFTTQNWRAQIFCDDIFNDDIAHRQPQLIP